MIDSVHGKVVYVALESEASGAPLSFAWLRETHSPYRVGRGVRIRIGTRALQIGLCRRLGSEKEVLQGSTFFRRSRPVLDVEAPPEEIRLWGLTEEEFAESMHIRRMADIAKKVNRGTDQPPPA